jgi:hypothetical protein
MSLLEIKHERYSGHMTKKKPAQKPSLTLHSLLGALTFWGTATRALLFSFLGAVTFIIALSEATSYTAVDNEVMTLIYVLCSFVLLDFGYVLIVRSYLLPKALDVLALVVADAVVALLYIVPKIVVTSETTQGVNPLIYIIFIPIVVLSIRMLLGMLFGKRPR